MQPKLRTFYMRYFFEIQYQGAPYAGWQSQNNATGVQQVVEDALTTIFRKPIAILGSGRTDARVHCSQQFFHADLDDSFEEQTWRTKLNSFLPATIAIRSILRVAENAHARFDATDRSYEYRITTQKNPFLEGLALHYFKSLDLSTMNEAAALLVGVHDFTSFSKVKTDVSNFICNVTAATWEEQGELVVFYITANRFLRGMVRAIVGTLLDVGTGKLTVAEFQDIINEKDRTKAGANVSPYGLFLTGVKYPASIFK